MIAHQISNVSAPLVGTTIPVDPWLTEECLADLESWLRACQDSEMLSDLRQCCPGYAIKEAAKRLDAGTKAQIKVWVIEQNDLQPTASVEVQP